MTTEAASTKRKTSSTNRGKVEVERRAPEAGMMVREFMSLGAVIGEAKTVGIHAEATKEDIPAQIEEGTMRLSGAAMTTLGVAMKAGASEV
jgi:hypothetical protein